MTAGEMARKWADMAMAAGVPHLDHATGYYVLQATPEQREAAAKGQGYWEAAKDAHGEAFEEAALAIVRGWFAEGPTA